MMRPVSRKYRRINCLISISSAEKTVETVEGAGKTAVIQAFREKLS
jgi:hypothetical protein